MVLEGVSRLFWGIMAWEALYVGVLQKVASPIDAERSAENFPGVYRREVISVINAYERLLDRVWRRHYRSQKALHCSIVAQATESFKEIPIDHRAEFFVRRKQHLAVEREMVGYGPDVCGGWEVLPSQILVELLPVDLDLPADERN